MKTKQELIIEVSALVEKKRRLYSNMDIESPMCEDEKALTKQIADIYSQINQIVRNKRKS